jgi:UDP-N-acetylmuramoyl-tripeptide--D-alanyl-D-alanine ligase
MLLSLEEVAAILGAPCRVPERKALGFSIDTRTLAAGELFFAIRGPKFDGHQFVQQAFERGAVAAVVEERFREGRSEDWAQALIPVANTTEGLQRLARAVRRKWGRRLVAITGSTGKTTTKELIASALGRRLAVLKSPGNLNNDFGLPLALLALKPEHDVAVMELAMSAPGEIARLARIAEPQVGVVTNIAPVHLEFFDSVDAIGRAKGELVENLSSRGEGSTVVLNHDDARVRAFAEGFAGHVVTFGLGAGADFRGLDLQTAPGNGTVFRVKSAQFDGEYFLPLPGRHNVLNGLAAIAVSSLFGLPLGDMQRALAEFQTLPQRSEILTLSGGVTIINDCYNSNPVAMQNMLETLATWPAARRIVIAGEMRELGPTSPDWHREVGRTCVESGVDWLLAVQGDARFFLEGAADAGLPAAQAKFFESPLEAGEFCRALLRPADVVLVKGSRAVGLEKVIQLLRPNSEDSSRRRVE